MEKSADFIRKKEFHVVFKGYKPEEVDKFLDILSVEFDRLLKRTRELQDSLDKLKFENTEEDTDIKKVIQDALISAHKVAEDIKSQAKKEADSMIDQRKAMEDRSLHDIEMKKLAMEESLIVLQGKYDDFKNRIKKTILDMTNFVDEAGIGPKENEYTEADFTDIKFDAGQYEDQVTSAEPMQKMATEEVKEEPPEEPEILPGLSSLTENLSSIENTSTDSNQKMSVFDNYNLDHQRDSGSYFERIQNQNLETGRESLKEWGLGNRSSDAQTEDMQTEGMQREDAQTEDMQTEGMQTEDAQTEESQTEDMQREDAQTEESQTEGMQTEEFRNDDADDSSLKRERKKIDIANPDIIENFFRTSED